MVERANKAITDNEMIRCYNELGKTLVIGYCVRQRQMGDDFSLNEIKQKLANMYKPHKDYESVATLEKNIEKALQDLNKRANEKECFSKDEIGVFQNEFLRIASDCFRLNGTTICEAESLEKKQMLMQ